MTDTRTKQARDAAFKSATKQRLPVTAAIRAAFAERNRIVAWLRGEIPSGYTDPQFDIGFNLADAIARDQHHKETNDE